MGAERSMLSKAFSSSSTGGTANCLSGDVGAFSGPRAGKWAACEAGGGC